jgi:hypothetical protein
MEATMTRVLLFLVLPAVVAAQPCTPFGNAPRPIVPDTTVLVPRRNDDAVLTDATDGTPRLLAPGACGTPLPLITCTPPLFTADTLAAARRTSSFQSTADLTGDPARPGFIVVAPEDGRRPTSIPRPTIADPAGTTGTAS